MTGRRKGHSQASAWTPSVGWRLRIQFSIRAISLSVRLRREASGIDLSLEETDERTSLRIALQHRLAVLVST